MTRTCNVDWSRRAAGLIQVTAAVACLAGFATAHAQSDWVSTATHAHPTGNAKLVRNLQDTEVIDIVVGLRPRNGDSLTQLSTSQRDSNDPLFRHWMSSEEVVANFSPTQAQADSVVAYLTAHGFFNVQVAANRLLISASGTAASIRKAFHTQLAHFTRDGKGAIANLNDAQVPSRFRDVIVSVLGLQTLDQAHTSTVVSHDPVQFPTAYNAASLPSASKTAIGIITEGSMTQPIADLHTFETQNALPTINPTVVLVGGTSTDTSNQLEWDLDTQTIQAQAGGTIKQMLLYTAVSLTDAAVTSTYNKAVSDNIATIINVSLMECEATASSDGSLAQDDFIFKMATLQGQTFSASSGDDGSTQCGNQSVSYPASSPSVIAVGGTTLSTNANGTYASETAWSHSGGGPSAHEAQPDWQSGIVPGSFRGVPDVAFDADPASGAVIVVSGAHETVGGTSLASPIFVGSWARIQSLHNNTLGFPASWIYAYGAIRPAGAFHDVTSGSNGGFSASVGWDYVTGWGSWDVSAVATAISGYVYDRPVMTEGTLNAKTGFNSEFGVGSMSPAATSNGHTYVTLFDQANPAPKGGGYAFSVFAVSGFTADPGQAWLVSVTAQGTTLEGRAAGYTFSSGQATWMWEPGPDNSEGFNFLGSGTTPCLIIHK